MKKLVLLSLSVLLVLGLSACGNKENSDDQSASAEEAVDFEAIWAGQATDVVYGKTDAATKQKIIDEAKKEGIEVSFGLDGSMTMVEKDGAVMTQNPDGIWSYKDADGSEVQVGSKWPDNEYTKLIPEPDFTILLAGVEGNSFTVSFTEVTSEQLKAYVEEIKKAGFINEAEIVDQEYAGVSTYSYTAKNDSGYRISIILSGEVCNLMIEKE